MAPFVDLHRERELLLLLLLLMGTDRFFESAGGWSASGTTKCGHRTCMQIELSPETKRSNSSALEDDPCTDDMQKCLPAAPLMIHIVLWEVEYRYSSENSPQVGCTKHMRLSTTCHGVIVRLVMFAFLLVPAATARLLTYVGPPLTLGTVNYRLRNFTDDPPAAAFKKSSSNKNKRMGLYSGPVCIKSTDFKSRRLAERAGGICVLACDICDSVL